MRTETQPVQELWFTGKYNDTSPQLKAEPATVGMKAPLMGMVEGELSDLASRLLCDCGPLEQLFS